MPIVRHPAAPRIQMAHRVGRPAAPDGTASRRPSRPAVSLSPRGIGAGIGLAFLAGVAILGILNPAPAAGRGSGPAATAAPSAVAEAATSVVGSDWGGVGGMDLLDLITKGGLVLILLFITLRVLGRMQASSPRKGGRLAVLESRTLASKASLHLVAVGERRLVVGLTPNGMVALAELDADELETAEAADAAANAAGAGSAESGLRTSDATGAAMPATFAAVLAPFLAPIDRATDRLAGFIGGGKAR